MKQRVVSGVQPSGRLHVGNYLGSFANFLTLQANPRYECFFFIADLHALTEDYDPTQKPRDVLETATSFLALGLDPKRCTLFIQSYIPAHAELAWLLNTITPMSELGRMTQYKDKMSRQHENVNVGLFDYPVLQAADVLLYDAELVPVGEDQLQHLELMRALGRKFNRRFEKTFTDVRPLLTKTPRVMSLLEPTKKMSKSLGGDHVLNLTDEPEVIRQKLQRAVTATTGGSGNAGVENLFFLLRSFSREATVGRFETEEQRGTIRYAQLKEQLVTDISAHFADFRERRRALLRTPARIRRIFEQGSKRAGKIAAKKLTDVQRVMGLR